LTGTLSRFHDFTQKRFGSSQLLRATTLTTCPKNQLLLRTRQAQNKLEQETSYFETFVVKTHFGLLLWRNWTNGYHCRIERLRTIAEGYAKNKCCSFV